MNSLPTAGGRYARDPKTGALTQLPEDDAAPTLTAPDTDADDAPTPLTTPLKKGGK
ncbi:hypothetical protein [Pseudorhodobacter sp.]|uniref:hypothetical protein n=1 Tax=Pseudorhodobacter sp. TaxID=1934400 RepID=UPI002AFFB75C|nr:hypothetical protein [Pseudorhodobacter sp.]